MLNRCEFIGRLAADVEIRYTQSGAAVANFTVACGEKWKDKATGEQKETTEFVKCNAWNKLAEIMGKYLSKGSMVYVAGAMATRKYEKDGITHYITEIKVNEMKMIDSKKQDGQGQPSRDTQQEAYRQTGYTPPVASRQDGNEPPFMSDMDIPF